MSNRRRSYQDSGGPYRPWGARRHSEQTCDEVWHILKEAWLLLYDKWPTEERGGISRTDQEGHCARPGEGMWLAQGGPGLVPRHFLRGVPRLQSRGRNEKSSVTPRHVGNSVQVELLSISSRAQGRGQSRVGRTFDTVIHWSVQEHREADWTVASLDAC